MENFIFYGALILGLVIAFEGWKSNSKLFIFLGLLVFGYAIYTHSTGRTFSDFQKESVNDFDKFVGNDKYKQKDVNLTDTREKISKSKD